MSKLSINVRDWMEAASLGDMATLLCWEKTGALEVRYDPVSVGVVGISGRAKIFEVTDASKENALHKALRACHVEYAQKLLSLGRFPATESTYGYTPLHLACQQGLSTLVDRLVAAGHPLHPICRKGGPILFEAIKAKSAACVALLLAADPTANAHPDIEHALHEAVKSNHPEIVELLLAHGFDPNAPDDPTRPVTPLQLAAMRWDWEDCKNPQSALSIIITQLIAAGADPELGLENEATRVHDLFRPKEGGAWLDRVIVECNANALAKATPATARRSASSRL